MKTATPYIREGQSGKLWKILFYSNIPAPGLGVGEVVGLRGQGQRQRICSYSARIIYRSGGDCLAVLEGSVAAQLYRIANSYALNKTSTAGAQDRCRVELVGDADTWLNIRINCFGVTGAITA